MRCRPLQNVREAPESPSGEEGSCGSPSHTKSKSPSPNQDSQTISIPNSATNGTDRNPAELGNHGESYFSREESSTTLSLNGADNKFQENPRYRKTNMFNCLFFAINSMEMNITQNMKVSDVRIVNVSAIELYLEEWTIETFRQFEELQPAMLPPPVQIEFRDNDSISAEPSIEYDIAVMCKDALDDFCTSDEKELSALTEALMGGIFFFRFIGKPEYGWKGQTWLLDRACSRTRLALT